MSYADEFNSPPQATAAGSKGDAMGSVDAQYFGSYGSDFSVHRVMLSDAPRMAFYRSFYIQNRELVANSIVIDVGAGTGLLSMWAAKLCKPLKVIAVEASPFSESLLHKVIADNGFKDKIHVVGEKMEKFVMLHEFMKAARLTEDDLQLCSRIIIVSEWMGFYLLHEGMLPSVLYARDLILSGAATLFCGPEEAAEGHGGKDVLLVPDHATIWIAPVQLTSWKEQRFLQFWKDATPNGELNMDSVGEAEADQFLAAAVNPVVEVLPADSILAPPKELFTFDLLTLKASELMELNERATFNFPSSGQQADWYLDGFAIWFDVSFRGLMSRKLLMSPKGSNEPPPRRDSAAGPLLRKPPAGGASEEDCISIGSSMSDSSNHQASFVTSSSSGGNHLTLRTGPMNSPTHWKQSIIMLPPDVRGTISVKDQLAGSAMGAEVSMVASSDADDVSSRCYQIGLELFDPAEY